MTRRVTPATAAFLLVTITVGLLLLVPRYPAGPPAGRPRPRPWTPRPRYSPAEVKFMERQVQREISMMEHGYAE